LVSGRREDRIEREVGHPSSVWGASVLLLVNPDEDLAVALDGPIERHLARDRPRSQRAVVELEPAGVEVDRQDQRQPAALARLEARLEDPARAGLGGGGGL